MCLLTEIDGLTFAHISDVHFEQSVTPLGSNRSGVVRPSPTILWLVVAPTILWHEDLPFGWEGTKLEFRPYPYPTILRVRAMACGKYCWLARFCLLL